MQQLVEHSTHKPELLFVKWATPTEEALSTVKLAQAYVDRRIALPEQLAIVVPNRIWASNINRAATSLGIAVSSCIVQQENEAIARALNKLKALEGDGLQGATLVRRAGLESIPELGHALLHAQGNETACELEALIHDQLAHPSVATRTSHIPVMLLENICSSPEYVFLVGCVEGLIPSSATCTSVTGSAQKMAMEEQRAMFDKAVQAARKRATISYFVKAPERLATQLSLRASRYKNENGTRMAMVGPSQFITEKGQKRPTTTGGQTLLRAYGLN